MARKLFDIGIFNALGANSALGTGWKLNFYTGGTTTRITTYNARSAGSANANPIVADGNGRFDEIWIEAPQTIKWVLTDASDVVKVTVDDVLFAADATATAAGLATFLAGSAPLAIASGGTGQTSAVNALAALLGLPLAGGTVTGNIIRSAAGGHLYHTTAAMTSGRVFLTASADPDPTSLPGDIWLKY